MLSAGSTTPPEPNGPTLFIDRNSGGRSFRALLEQAGVRVVLHDDLFPHTMADEDWLAAVANKKYLIVTGDDATTRSPLFVQRLNGSQAYVFVLLALNGLSADAKAQCILSAYPKMCELAASHEPPALWRIGRDGMARRFNHGKTLEQMLRRNRCAKA